MLSMALAEDLQQAGLKWEPALHDFFAVPRTELSDRLFVISDMMADIGVLQGWPAITFNGAVEWALDYILTMDALWMPTETQLRQMVMARADAGPITLSAAAGRYTVTFWFDGVEQSASADSGSDAYARALLQLLQREGAAA